MRAKPIPMEEQYKLVLECRQSGLSDYHWCLEHDIKPGTFYNWVKRLRKAGTYTIQSRPPPAETRIQPCPDRILSKSNWSKNL